MALSSAQNWHGLAFFSCHAGSNGGFVKWVALIATCSPAIIDFLTDGKILGCKLYSGMTCTLADTVHGTLHKTCALAETLAN